CITQNATRKTDSVYVAQCNIYSVMRRPMWQHGTQAGGVGEQFGPPQKESFRRKKPKMGVLLYTVGAVVGIRLLRVGCSTTTTTMRTIALTIVRTTAVTTSRTIPISGRACSGRCYPLIKPMR
ncbi:MAG: hypothetical protein KBS86_01805, partial [Proteobacteria bacterium]|nr:hypothetical protein [Candidatus Enterousia scatequi]